MSEDLKQLTNKYLPKKPDVVPAGFYTVAQWAEKSDLSYSHSYRLLTDLVKAGNFERRMYRIEAPNQMRLLPTPHYGEVKKPKPKGKKQ